MRPLDDEFALELSRLVREEPDVGFAEAHRRLIPIAKRLGRRRPSYWVVRDFMLDERILRGLEEARADERRELLLDVAEQIAKGRMPKLWR